jgi:hypothetical protein
MYGHSGSALRRAMTDLLQMHRVQRRFGAADQVASHVLLVRQYRENVLAWCGNALQLALPMSFTNLPPRNPNPFEPSGNRSAARDLARELARVRESSSITPAILEQLTIRHQNTLVEHWRQVARAAALAEGDLDQMARPGITTEQAAGVVSDVSAITRHSSFSTGATTGSPGGRPSSRGQVWAGLPWPPPSTRI